MGRLASKIVPRRQMVQKIEPKILCRDEELCKEFEADELCHDTGTLEGLAGMLQRTEDLDGGRLPTGDLEGCSLWVGHGTEDRVTSFKATARFMDRIPIKDKTFKIYDGYYHKRAWNPCNARFSLLTPFSARRAWGGQVKICPGRSRLGTRSLCCDR